MKERQFKEKALKQDKRNIFANYSENISLVPTELQKFFIECNPIDVEVSMNGNMVKFYPFSDLQKLQAEYNLSDKRFVFSTCNSDPIYYWNGAIYSCCHEGLSWQDEFLAENFWAFLSLID